MNIFARLHDLRMVNRGGLDCDWVEYHGILRHLQGTGYRVRARSVMYKEVRAQHT
jgi:hypothetical protein